MKRALQCVAGALLVAVEQFSVTGLVGGILSKELEVWVSGLILTLLGLPAVYYGLALLLGEGGSREERGLVLGREEPSRPERKDRTGRVILGYLFVLWAVFWLLCVLHDSTRVRIGALTMLGICGLVAWALFRK